MSLTSRTSTTFEPHSLCLLDFVADGQPQHFLCLVYRQSSASSMFSQKPEVVTLSTDTVQNLSTRALNGTGPGHQAQQAQQQHSPGAGDTGSPSPPQPAGPASAGLHAKSSAGEQLTLASAAGPSVRQISKLKRFLTTLYQFACDIGPEVGERVHTLITGLVNSAITIEDFHQKIQDSTRYPLRPYVIPFLRLHLPVLQNEIMHFARLAKLTPAQYIRQHESLILDPVSTLNGSSGSSLAVGEPFEIFQPNPQDSVATAMGVKEQLLQQAKRRLSPEGRGKENSPEDKDGPPPAKRHQALVGPTLNSRPTAARITPALHHTPISSHHHPSGPASLIHSHLTNQARAALAAEADRVSERLSSTSMYQSNGHSSRESMANGRNQQPTAPEHLERERYALAAERYEKEYMNRSLPTFYSELQRNYTEELTRDMEEEWKNIYTMLNCILGMVDKTKRALAILQHRSLEQFTNSIWSPPGRVQARAHYPPLSHEVALEYLKKVRNEGVGSSSNFQLTGHSNSAESDRLPVNDNLRRPRMPMPTSLETVNEVKRHPINEMAKNESKANDFAERSKMDKILAEARRQAAEDALSSINRQEDTTENCWNCGRKANETCSGCSVARYCGSFCQHKDWENHHRICGQTRPIDATVGSSTGNGKLSPLAVEIKRSKSTPSPGSGPGSGPTSHLVTGNGLSPVSETKNGS
ncbi:Protein CBFA2T2 [Halotydeus destructor]|nr:Protein CBFA2T2 [Halotydeus destructor]